MRDDGNQNFQSCRWGQSSRSSGVTATGGSFEFFGGFSLQEPNYTQVPNSLLDNLAKASDAELRVLLAICRQTFGWQRKRATLSTSFLAKAGGLSDQGVLNAVKRLLDKKVIARVSEGGSFSYALVLSPPNGVGRGVPTVLGGGVPTVLGGGVPTVLGGGTNGVGTAHPNGVGTNKETDKERDPSAIAAGLEHKAFFDGWTQAFESTNGVKYQVDGGRDGKAVKELLKMGILRIDLLEIAKNAWKLPDRFLSSRALTIHGFREHFNAIHTGVKNGHTTRGQCRNEVDRNAGTANEGRAKDYAHLRPKV